jgi:hypothetical protein
VKDALQHVGAPLQRRKRCQEPFLTARAGFDADEGAIMKKTYSGSCHCGAVRLEAGVDLSAGTFKCNCPICAKSRNWSIVVSPTDFRLLAGETELVSPTSTSLT